MDTTLKDLIGKKITNIYANENYLRFKTEHETLTYKVWGDCCSTSYFYDFFGIKNLLNNGIVKEVKKVELNPTDIIKTEYGMKDKKQENEEIQVYGYQITTESKEFGDMTSVFSFRNASNGYYGGGIEKSTYEKELPELTEDTTEIK